MESIVTHDNIQWIVQLLVIGVVIYLPKILNKMEERIDRRIDEIEKGSVQKDKELKKDMDERYNQLRSIDYNQWDEFHKIKDKMRDVESQSYKEFMLKEDYHKWKERVRDKDE